MRVLCLHGAGTNADIFERQTSALRYHLKNDNIEFVYVDGEYDARPAPEISPLYPGPYYAYYDWDPYDAPMRPPLETLADSHEYLASLLLPEDEGGMGPFDGILGFSQGAALAMSYLLWREGSSGSGGGNEDDTIPGVRFAAFFCGSRPWDRDGLIRLGTKNFMAPPSPDPEDPGSEESSLYGSDSDGGAEAGVVASRLAARPVATALPKLRIPTMHVLGAQDMWFEESQQLLGMCDAKEILTWQHDLGHVIPMDKKSTEQMCSMFRKMVRRAEFKQ
ncbi:ef-hand calcium-binding domain protein [Xylariomycetidae sp. FL2044]|nr:ef-hand calcium-binding domain protein [Xylariomycetidae sp. FL2044]